MHGHKVVHHFTKGFGEIILFTEKLAVCKKDGTGIL